MDVSLPSLFGLVTMAETWGGGCGSTSFSVCSSAEASSDMIESVTGRTGGWRSRQKVHPEMVPWLENVPDPGPQEVRRACTSAC